MNVIRQDRRHKSKEPLAYSPTGLPHVQRLTARAYGYSKQPWSSVVAALLKQSNTIRNGVEAEITEI